MDVLRFLLVTLACLIDRRNQLVIAYLKIENEVLREQLGGRRLRFTNANRRKLGRAAKDLGRAELRELQPVVTPDTLLRWYRSLVARKYDGTGRRRRAGKEPVSGAVRSLIIKLARENNGWGYTRILGALRLLGHKIGRTSVRRILEETGIDPAPKRGMTWETFLRAHWSGMFATDFFHVEVLTLAGLARYQVLFVIELASRRVEIGGVVRDAYGEWTENVFRGLTLDGEMLAGASHLIMDRDLVFNRAVRELLADRGFKVVRLPRIARISMRTRSDLLGRYGRECLGKVIPLGEAHLRWLLREYVAHYNREWLHQGIGNRLVEVGVAANGPAGEGELFCRERAGGLLRFYQRKAA